MKNIMDNQENENQKDQQLWKTAKDRVDFRKHLYTYLVVNTFLWLLWWAGDDGVNNYGSLNLPWPVFSTVGWGIGLFFNYLGAYHMNGKKSAIEKEYEKLKAERGL